MRIINITYKKTLVPKSGSGTGYSEPDLFNVTFEDGSVYRHLVYVSEGC